MRSRRAISSVVGMVFAIIALTTTITYISYSMGILNNYNQSVLTQNQQLTNVGMEKFQIASVTIPNGKLNVTVTNTGNLPINFTKIWIQDTNVPDSVHSYIPTNNFVSPGGVLTNVGQNTPAINPTDSYNVKLVTSRGNIQQFTVNSAKTNPLNIQLYASPATIPSSFNTTLTMVVINNQTSTLVNVIPNTPSNSAPTNCILSSVSPANYNTLPPGATAIFQWQVKAAPGTSSGTICTFSYSGSTTPLQNGYSQSISTEVIINDISFASTTLAANVGTLTINYGSWQWTQGNGWVGDWTMPVNTPTGFLLNLTNNDPSRTFYLSNETSIVMYPAGTSSSAASYIVQSISSSGIITPFTCSGYPTNGYCISLPPQHWTWLYIGGGGPASIDGKLSKTPSQTGPASVYLLMFGKFDTSRSGNGLLYAQNIPFIAIYLH